MSKLLLGFLIGVILTMAFAYYLNVRGVSIDNFFEKARTSLFECT